MTGVTQNAPSRPPQMPQVLAAFRSQARMEMAFGGVVAPQSGAFAITDDRGGRSGSLVNLIVRTGAGLGGKALLLGRPVSVTSYERANGITHVYDSAVRQESLETVAALPVIVDGAPRMVIYVASRTQVALGDRFFDGFTPLLRRLERDIAVEDEVRRRLEVLRDASQPGLGPDDVRSIVRELAELTAQVQDAPIKQRLLAVSERLSATAPSTTLTVPLSPREIDVLVEVARGRSNREVAEQLGLLPNTVKAYMKTAMRKLQATNRVQAISAARDAGVVL